MVRAQVVQPCRWLRSLLGSAALSGDYELAGLVEPIQHHSRLRGSSHRAAGKLENHKVLPVRRHVVGCEWSAHFQAVREDCLRLSGLERVLLHR
jgi:hypothetical protein